jgi:malate dehydrogenase (oxaloacetate-decarboxylating)(NADP+)
MSMREQALEYHRRDRKGKIEISITKSCKTQQDITLAYSPGVAEPCKEIAQDPNAAFEYTTKGNLVAVVSNGTAVLGLGNIGPLASKPVMEGKAVLFKTFADIDCFDIEIKAPTAEDVIRTCQALEPTFGGINLEDIRAPECFEIEETLQRTMDIPVFHDDQHGTAIVSSAALLNALELTGRSIESTIIVVNGAGAAATACAKLYLTLGVKPQNLFMCDRAGVIYEGRSEDMSPHKLQFALPTNKRTLLDAMKGADVFCGCSVGGAVSQEMVRVMAPRPIIFAMANPEPEIRPEQILAVRDDAIIATGRSDYPNQVNNVLGYPYIFRGALDVHARRINEEMKMAAVKAIATLAKEDVPDSVSQAYSRDKYTYGPDYLIPKPFDPRLMLWIAPAVARAAMESGVARKEIDIENYVRSLEARLGVAQGFVSRLKRQIQEWNRAQGRRIRLALPEGSSPKILRAAEQVVEAGLCDAILLGRAGEIRSRIHSMDLKGLYTAQIIDPSLDENCDHYASRLFEKRGRSGITRTTSRELVTEPQYFASLMVECGDADVLCSGVHHNYPDTIRPALHVFGTPDNQCLAGIYLLMWKNRSVVFADTTVNIDPDENLLAKIAIQTHDTAQNYLTEPPRVAMLSFSNFGSNKHPNAVKMKNATRLVKALRPDIVIDGEMHADTALDPEALESSFPFSDLKDAANVLIFPDLQSGNIAYKLLGKLGGATLIGPILIGTNKAFNVIQRNSPVEEIVNLFIVSIHKTQNNF